ncbi:histidine phosphotransferase family protein [Oceaniglobus roseus]|uniref:histidine phosphotransferase family protein n=1 Tax=Oceaniglobus roseus TaxID=1737570 RepID=UPI000C7F52D0|nr:histidine phosphotransferase family protein [Kandeliimicrobium roseum]
MTATTKDLEALLGSRICHDLISPLGAIANGLELLGMTELRHSPEYALIAQSVAHANARVRFFRVAFGVAGHEQQIGAPEIRDLLEGLAADGRLAYRWLPEEPLARPQVKLAFLLLQCLETALPWGGEIVIEGDGQTLTLGARAARIRALDGLWDHFDTPGVPPEVEASLVHFPLAARAAAELGRPVRRDETPEGAPSLSF